MRKLRKRLLTPRLRRTQERQGKVRREEPSSPGSLLLRFHFFLCFLKTPEYPIRANVVVGNFAALRFDLMGEGKSKARMRARFFFPEPISNTTWLARCYGVGGGSPSAPFRPVRPAPRSPLYDLGDAPSSPASPLLKIPAGTAAVAPDVGVGRPPARQPRASPRGCRRGQAAQRAVACTGEEVMGSRPRARPPPLAKRETT